MNEDNEAGVESTQKLRRKLLWAYGIIGALVLLLIWSLLARGAGSPEIAQTEQQNPFSLCIQKLGEGQAADALPSCEQAVELQPESLGAQHNLGYAYKMTGQYDRAIQVLQAVVAKDPLNVRSTYELADSYAGAGQVETARATFSRVLEIDPDHGWARRRLQELSD